MLRVFRLRYCRARMADYLDGRLSLRARRRIAHYIDMDTACYAEYVRQREVRRELAASLPRVGKANPTRLDALWTAIQADLMPDAQRRVIHPTLLPFRARYGFAGMAIGLLVMLPLTVGSGGVSFALPHQPEPRTQVMTATANAPQVAYIVQTATPNRREPRTPQTAALLTRATPTPKQW
jgi:anti-sigma factor RsiW